MDLRFASLTDVGKVRRKNDDSLLADLPLVAVADGMGGYEGGDVASQLALETLASWKERLTGDAGRAATGKLREAFEEANRAVWERGQQEERLSRMGTTLTAGWIDGDTLALAHVGDSRAYLLRSGELEQLTHDQTVAQDLVRRGRISEDQAAASPHRHMLLQAIGADPDDGLDIEVTTTDLRAGDRLLLASDGLYGMVKDADSLRDLLAQNEDPDATCRALVDAANEAGGEDNISVLIIDIVGVDGVAAAPPSEEAPHRAEPAVEPAERSGPSRSRILLFAGAVAFVAVAAAVFLIARVNSQTLLVAERGGAVVVLKGRQGDIGEPARGDVVRVFARERLDRFPRTVREDLKMGIPVDSMAEARRVVSNLPRLLGPRDTPTPSPTSAATTSPAATSSPNAAALPLGHIP